MSDTVLLFSNYHFFRDVRGRALLWCPSCPPVLVKEHVLREALGGRFLSLAKPPWASQAVRRPLLPWPKALLHEPRCCSCCPPAKRRDTSRPRCGLLSLAFHLAGCWGPRPHLAGAEPLCVSEDSRWISLPGCEGFPLFIFGPRPSHRACCWEHTCSQCLLVELMKWKPLIYWEGVAPREGGCSNRPLSQDKGFTDSSSYLHPFSPALQWNSVDSVLRSLSCYKLLISMTCQT